MTASLLRTIQTTIEGEASDWLRRRADHIEREG